MGIHEQRNKKYNFLMNKDITKRMILLTNAFDFKSTSKSSRQKSNISFFLFIPLYDYLTNIILLLVAYIDIHMSVCIMYVNIIYVHIICAYVNIKYYYLVHTIT